MTIFNIIVQSPLKTKADAYALYGPIAAALSAIPNLCLIEITDDMTALAEPSIPPARPRKPRGKNKPKVQDGSIPWSEPVQSIGGGKTVPLEPIPASLKRTAE